MSYPRNLALLSQRLNELYTKVERQKNVVVPVNVRYFAESFITESLVMRNMEWLNKQNLDLSSPTQMRTAVESTIVIVSDILAASAVENVRGVDYITLIGVLEQIHKNWCRIFPFCR